MKKHCEIDFIDGKIVHSVNRCIVYNNKHIEVARFKQPDGKLNLYEFNKRWQEVSFFCKWEMNCHLLLNFQVTVVVQKS